ncbi:MAG: hypothetical protein SV186_02835 [Candidatus Nanohaloarchaea archaeon]|nr:hypothetical protein [Candidatus Nanohaloarchaea archaeon]
MTTWTELTEDERAFLQALVAMVKEDIAGSDRFEAEQDPEAFTRNLLLEGFPLREEASLDRIADRAGVDREAVFAELLDDGAVERVDQGEKLFLRIDATLVDEHLL